MKDTMRRIASTIVLVLLACSARSATNNGQHDDKGPTMTPSQPPSPPTTTLEQVQQAYPHSRVGRSDLSVPGVELFLVMTDREVPHDAENLPTMVAITGGVGSPILQGRDVTKAVIQATRDPMILARVAMAVEEQSGELLTAPKNDEQKKANVGPPTISGNTLTFWIWTSGVGRMLELAKLDLTSGALQVTEPPQSPDDQLAEAIELLASNNRSLEAGAVGTLAAMCASNAAARTALLDAIAKHKREETRIAAVDAAPACGPAAIDTLVAAMERDASATVRWKAARALGKIGDRKAIPALEKAAKSSDPDLKEEATEALGKLK